jgi:4-amino-4-deoxy-L-arabinose transferase-like glycosyltransferase
MPARRGFVTRLALVAAAGLAIRVGFVLAERRHTKPVGDDFYYHWQGVLLAQGKGFVDAFTYKFTGVARPGGAHPPLYSTYLAVWSKLGFQSVLEHRLASCLLGAATCFVIGLVAYRLAGPRAGLAAAAIAAVYPNLWINDANLMSESLYALAIALVVLAAYAFVQSPKLANALWLGFACGAAALTRAEAALLFPLLVAPLVLLRGGRPWPEGVRWTAAAGLVGMVIIGPWVGANLVRFEKPETMSSGSGQVLAIGNCDKTYHGEYLGYWHRDCSDLDWPPGCDRTEVERRRDGDLSVPPCDESVIDAAKRELGLEYVKDNLDRLPVVMLARMGRAFDVYAPFQGVRFNWFFESRGPVVSRWALWVSWAAFALGIAGAVGLRRRRITLIPMGAIVVMIAATAALTFGITRYRVPVDVVAIVLAGVAIESFLARRTPPETPAVEVRDPLGVAS